MPSKLQETHKLIIITRTVIKKDFGNDSRRCRMRYLMRWTWMHQIRHNSYHCTSTIPITAIIIILIKQIKRIKVQTTLQVQILLYYIIIIIIIISPTTSPCSWLPWWRKQNTAVSTLSEWQRWNKACPLWIMRCMHSVIIQGVIGKNQASHPMNLTPSRGANM